MRTIYNFFLSPSVILDKYIEKPKWVLKWLVYSILTALVTQGTIILSRPAVLEITKQAYIDRGLTQDQIDAALNITASPFMNYFTLIGAFLGVLIFTFLIVLFYYLAQRLVGGEGTYIQTMAIVTLSFYTTLIGSVIKLVYMYYTHSMVFAGLEQDFTSILMQYIDPFYIWGIVIIVIGFMRVCKLSLTKAIVTNAIIVLGSMGFSYLLLLISGAMK